MYGCKLVSTPRVTNEKLQKVYVALEADASRYRSLVRSLLYLTTTRLDIMFATSLLSRFMQNPSQIHLGVGKRILSYLFLLEDKQGFKFGGVDNVDFYHYLGYLLLTKSNPLELLTHLILTFTLLL